MLNQEESPIEGEGEIKADSKIISTEKVSLSEGGRIEVPTEATQEQPEEKPLDELSKSEQVEAKQELIEKSQGDGASDDDDEEGDDDKKAQIKFVQQTAKDIAQIQDAEEQIEKIVILATEKSPYTAIEVAQSLDSNYILDRVHDELVEEKVRKILVEKGLLKEI